MNRLYRSLLLFCFGLVAFCATSCRKGAYVAPVSTVTVASDENGLNALFAALQSAPQQMTVAAGREQTIYGLYGTKITFYPNSFKDKNGNVLRNGAVNIQLREIYTVGDMVANRAATTANGKLLTSGGQVQITANANGQEVFANKYGIGFRHLKPSAQPMTLFYGDNADFVSNWTICGDPQAGNFVPGTSTSADTNVIFVITSSGVDTVITHGIVTNYYQFDSCTNFNWINCDYFYTSGAQLTNVKVALPDSTYNQSNTEVFLVFPAINAASHMTRYNPATNTFELQNGYYVPIGMQVDVVVVSKIGVSYYFNSHKGMTTSDNMVVYADMALVSLDYIRAQLSAL